MIYTYIIGDEYLLSKKIEGIIKTENFETITISEDKSFQKITDALSTVSFFDEKKIIIAVKILGGLTESENKKLINLLESPNECDIYFFENKKVTGSETLSWLKKNSKFTEKQIDKNFNQVEYIKKEVELVGGEISPLAAQRLAQYTDGDLWRLSEEIKKLVAYKKSDQENKTIEASDVSLLVSSDTNLNIFHLIDAFATKNTKRAAELLNDFIDMGTNEIYLLTMIEHQFRNIALAKFEPKVTESILIKSAGLHPFVAKKSIAQAKGFEKANLIEIFEKLSKADLRLKSGYDSKQTLLAILS